MEYLTIAAPLDTSERGTICRKIEDADIRIMSVVLGAANIDMLGTQVVSVKGHVERAKIQELKALIPGLRTHDSPPSLQDIPLQFNGEAAGAQIPDQMLLNELDDGLTAIDYKIDDRLIYLYVESRDTTTEMQSFFVDFLSKSKQAEEAGEIVVLGRKINSHYVCGFYGVLPPHDVPEPHKLATRLTARLLKRKNITLRMSDHDTILQKHLANHNIIRTTVLKDYNTFLSKAGECVLTSAQGISLETILQCLRSNNPQYVEPSLDAVVPTAPSLRTVRSVSTRKTAEEIDVDVRAKSAEIVGRINRYVPIEEQVRTKFEFNGDTINELVANRVFMTSERVFMRTNRHLIQSMIDQNIRGFKASEPADAKAKRLKTVQDERRALAESYAQKIREYCAKQEKDEYGSCKLKNAYTHKVLKIMEFDELITDEESDEARTVKDEIDELLSESRTENEWNNKGDLTKAKQLARRLLEIFLFEFEQFDDDELGNFNSDPRGYVYRNVYDSKLDFGATERALFGSVHHDMIVSTVRTEYEKVQQAVQMFIEAETLRRSEEVEDTEREAFEALQCAKREVNDEIMSVVTSLEALQISKNGGLFGSFIRNSFKEKYAQYKRDPSGFTLEQIAVFKEEERLAPIRTRLYARYNVQTVEELKAQIHPLEDYVRDLRPFTPLEHEVREYIRTNFTIICEN